MPAILIFLIVKICMAGRSIQACRTRFSRLSQPNVALAHSGWMACCFFCHSNGGSFWPLRATAGNGCGGHVPSGVPEGPPKETRQNPTQVVMYFRGFAKRGNRRYRQLCVSCGGDRPVPGGFLYQRWFFPRSDPKHRGRALMTLPVRTRLSPFFVRTAAAEFRTNHTPKIVTRQPTAFGVRVGGV